MWDRVNLSGENQGLRQVAAYHQDAQSALRLYYEPSAGGAAGRFADRNDAERQAELAARLAELDCRSAMALLAAVEATLRIDYLARCEKRKRDKLSRVLRDTYKAKGPRASLEEDILTAWQADRLDCRMALGSLKDAFRYRHWLAHGRYWTVKLGRADGRYDFETIYELVDALLTDLGLPVGPG